MDYIAALDGCMRITYVSSLVVTGSILLFLVLSLLEIPVKVATHSAERAKSGRFSPEYPAGLHRNRW